MIYVFYASLQILNLIKKYCNFATAAVYHTKLQSRWWYFGKILLSVSWYGRSRFVPKWFLATFVGRDLLIFMLHTNYDVWSSRVLMRHYVIPDVGEQWHKISKTQVFDDFMYGDCVRTHIDN